jgi:hypothetical protein
MPDLVEHLERFLGPIEAGWSVDADGASVPFQVVRCPAPSLAGCVAFSTLGLSTTALVSGTSGRPIRQELVMLLGDRWRDGPAPGLLQQVGRELLGSGSALLRGEVIGPRGPLVPSSRMEALYAAIPVYLPDAFGQVDGVVFAWLVPISLAEAALVSREGWETFEDRLIAVDPDLTDLARSSVVR